MRRYFDREYILKELRKIGSVLKNEVTFFLIVGGSLSIMDLKEATKDIDVILKSER